MRASSPTEKGMKGAIFMPEKAKKLPEKLRFWLKRENLMIIECWARHGLTDQDIAHNMHIARSTLSKYKKLSPEFCRALAESKEYADMRVENALYRRAINGDLGACVYWLKNRKPEAWRDKPLERSVGGSGGVIVLAQVEGE